MKSTLLWLLTSSLLLGVSERATAQTGPDLFARDNLVAWCIVPFDARKRGPEERAVMLQKLGFKHFAYDWRAEHIPTFDAEVESLRRHGIELTAWWFPTTLDAEARRILAVLDRHKIRTQLWVTGGGAAVKSPDEQRQRVRAEANRIRPIAQEAASLGCTVGLYNHGGWFGEPENQLAVLQELNLANVGLVYNLHHGHDHLERFPQLLEKMRPHLLAVNLNGMVKDGDRIGKKILPLGLGERDLELLRVIEASGYRGRIGILGHTQDDAEARLRDNLDGLEWLRARLAGKDPGPRPKYRTVPEQKPAAKATKADHWGVDVVGFGWTEGDSRDERWKDMEIGRWLASALPLPGGHGTVTKALSIRVGQRREATVCFDTESLKLRAAWTGGFLRFTPARFGLIAPPEIDGLVQFATGGGSGWADATGRYQGMYRHGERVVLSYSVTPASGVPVAVLESPWLQRGDKLTVFTRDFEVGSAATPLALILGGGERPQRVAGLDVAVASDGRTAFAVRGAASLRLTASGILVVEVPPADGLRRFRLALASVGAGQLPAFAAMVGGEAAEDVAALTKPGPSRWTAPITTQGKRAADDAPYVVDTLTLPFDNPYRALFFVGGHDFFRNGDLALCAVHGDVWRVSGVDENLQRLTWKRYATGLFQPLGLRIVDERVYVVGRDQITRLHDNDGDGEADFYESFCNLGRTSAGGHDYTTCLETDSAGNFYFLTAQEGVVRVSRDGKERRIVATGFRNPNGLGIGPGDLITVAPQEGEWTPASHIAVARPGSYHGYAGPRLTAQRPLGYDPPLCWIPRRNDNSSGGQVWAPDGWGPLGGQLLHFSYGQCRLLLVLRERLASGLVQGGTVDLPLTFNSGALRGRFSPRDGQLYVSGLKGWVTSAIHDGCLQRVRHTGRAADVPVRVETLQNGVAITWARPLDRASAEDPGSYHLQQWNYKYSAAYGSADYKVSDPRQEGHDEVPIASASLLDDRTVFLEIPGLRPVMQLAIRYALRSSDGAALRQTIHYTIHELGSRRMDPQRLTRPGVAVGAVDETQLHPGLIARVAQPGRSDVRTSRLAALFVGARECATPFLDAGSFRLAFEGFIRVPLRGDYELSVRGRGEVVLRVHGKEVLRGSGDLSQVAAGRVTLFKGPNALQLEYMPFPGENASIRLFWQGDDFAAEPVPPTALAHLPDASLRSAAELRRGRELFQSHHCQRCHAGQEPEQHEPPSLTTAGSRLSPAWMVRWIVDPAGLDGHATMPRLLEKGDAARFQKAADVAAYLATLSAAQASSDMAGDAAAGARLYEELNCMGCHRLTPAEAADAYRRRSLFQVGAKYQPGALRAYLLQPHAHHAASRMPDFRLSPTEAAALAAYLRRAAHGSIAPSAELAQADAGRGRELYRSLGCINCHRLGDERGRAAVPIVFGKTGASDGCLAGADRGRAPELGLDDSERRALQQFLASDGRALGRHAPSEEAQRLVDNLNCAACHNRDSMASARFEIAGDEGSGVIPEPLPSLTWTGEKLRGDWLESFLAGKVEPRLRPGLRSRMPAFPAYAAALARGLAAEHGIDPCELPTTKLDPSRAEVGERLARPTALDCRQCHAIGKEKLAGDAKTQLAVGIPFVHVRQRLREEFYRRFVLDPPRYDPHSKMPKLLGDGKTTKALAIYEGDAPRQIDALWHFILSAESPGPAEPPVGSKRQQ